jgi:hypothetical protein
LNFKLQTFAQAIFTVMGVATLGAGAQASTAGLTLATKTVAGRDMTLSFFQDEVTSAVTTAVVCSQPPATISQATLWMPDMGHGSSPTTLVPQDNQCTRVERLDFLMSGLWELRVTLLDGDSGVFSFDVAD